MRSLFVAAVSTSMSVLTAAAIVCAQGSQDWANGTWKGRIQGSATDKGIRIVIVDTAAGTCRWDRYDSNSPPRPCTVTNDTVRLTTGPGVTVELKRQGNQLHGTLEQAILVFSRVQ